MITSPHPNLCRIGLTSLFCNKMDFHNCTQKDSPSQKPTLQNCPYNRIGALVLSMRLHSLEVALYLCKSTILPCMDWAGAPLCFMSGLVPLVATWNCWINYKKGYAGLSVLQLLLLLNSWLVTKM